VTELHRPYEERSRSPWLDGLTLPHLRDVTLARYVAERIRGAGSTILTRAIANFHDSFAHVRAALDTKACRPARR